MDEARELLNEQGALLQEAEEQERSMVTQRVAAQIRLAQCEEALAKVLSELSGSNDDDDHESLPSLEENDNDPDPESTPDPPDPPDPALDEAPCPDRDRPPGDNPQPPCDQRAPAPDPAPKGIVGTPILVLEANKEPVLEGPEPEEWAGKTGKTMAELCKDTTAKEYLDCLLWICQAPHPLLNEEQLEKLAQLIYNPLTHKDVTNRLAKIIPANQLRRMKEYKVWPKDRVVSSPAAEAPAAEAPAEEPPPVEVLGVEVVPNEEEAAPSWANQTLWQKRMNQQSFMDNLTKDWAHPWEPENPPRQTAYFKEALRKIEHEVEALGSNMARLSEVPVLLRIAEEHLQYFVPDTFRPDAFWSVEVTKHARFAFFYEKYKPEWADAFTAFAGTCFNIADGLKERLPKMDKGKKKYTKRADIKIYNSLQVIANNIFHPMANVAITFFISNEYPDASDDQRAVALGEALPIWHQICTFQIQARRITRELPPESPLHKDDMLVRFDEAMVALGNAMIAFDDAVGAPESEAVRDLFTLFSEDYEEHRWTKDVRKRVRGMMTYTFDLGAYDRRVKSSR